MDIKRLVLHEKCPYLEFFWSAFSLIWIECGEVRSIFPYSVRIQENKDQKNSKYGHFSRSVEFCNSSKKLVSLKFL